jgi:proteic killer suppression protein
MNFPGSDFHALRGNLRGFYAVRVSANWRVIFRFDNTGAYDVDYLDYH